MLTRQSRSIGMPYKIRIDRARRLIELDFFGVLTSHECIASIDAMFADPDFDPGFCRLQDYDRALTGGLDAEQINQIKREVMPKLHAIYGSGVNYVAHVCADPYRQVLLKYWFAITERETPSKVRLFSTRADALDWLDTVNVATDRDNSLEEA
jgi:hypothetical protein